MLKPKKMKDKKNSKRNTSEKKTLLAGKKNHILFLLKTIVSRKRTGWRRVLREKPSLT